MELRRLRPDPIELHPRPRSRDLLVQSVIRFILGMNPDELRGTDPLGSDDFQLLHGSSPVTGMRSYRQSGLARSDRRGSCQLAVQLIERRTIDADLNEPRPPSLARLCHPPFRELRSRFTARKGRHILMAGRAVQTGVRPDLDARGIGKPRQEVRGPPLQIRRTLQQPAAAQPAHLFELGPRDAKYLVAVVPPRPYLIGAHKIDQDVLMHQHRCHLAPKRGNTRQRQKLAPPHTWYSPPECRFAAMVARQISAHYNRPRRTDMDRRDFLGTAAALTATAAYGSVAPLQIGRASCRERVEISVGARSLKKK